MRAHLHPALLQPRSRCHLTRLFPRCTRNFEPWRIAPEGSAPTSEMGNRWVQYCNVCLLRLRLQLMQLPLQVGGRQRSSAA